MNDALHLQQGRAAEALALAHLQAAGLRLLQQNYRPTVRGGGEIDLVMWDARAARSSDHTLVFVEVRARSHEDFGGGLISVDAHKRRKLLKAARFYLAQRSTLPPCRFDIVSVQGTQLQWLEAAFTLNDVPHTRTWR